MFSTTGISGDFTPGTSYYFVFLPKLLIFPCAENRTDSSHSLSDSVGSCEGDVSMHIPSCKVWILEELKFHHVMNWIQFFRECLKVFLSCSSQMSNFTSSEYVLSGFFTLFLYFLSVMFSLWMSLLALTSYRQPYLHSFLCMTNFCKFALLSMLLVVLFPGEVTSSHAFLFPAF